LEVCVMLRKAGFVLIATAIGVAATLGCEAPRARTVGATAAKANKTAPPTYAMNVVVSHVPFWADTRAAWAAVPRHFAVKTVFGGPQNDNSQEQINEIEAILATKPAGLVVAPTDSTALARVIDRAVAAGIPVVTYLVDAPESKRLTHITSALESASIAVAKQAVGPTAQAPRGGVIISYGTAGSEEQERRADGFRQFVAGNRGLRLVGSVEDKFDPSVGADQIKALLSRHKDVKYIFGCNSRSAAAAVLALRELGYRPGDIIVTGWDHDPDVPGHMSDGWVMASAAQQTTFMTNLAFSILHSAANGYMYPSELRLRQQGVSPLPARIEVPVAIITAKNAAAYQRVSAIHR
jgi:ABC-type sugar transport system substrate-binding protein